MINTNILGGMLSREYAEANPQRPRIPLGGPAPTSGSYDSSGINPGGTFYTGTTRPSSYVTTGGPLPPTQQTVTTGGPLPPSTIGNVHTGGPLPPSVTPGNVQTGGPLPPSVTPTNVQTGGPDPAFPAPGGTTPPPWMQGGQYTGPGNGGQPGPAANPASFAPVDVVQQMIDGMMNGQYGQDARRQGMELANQRGLINSSIAAGASQRAALEGIQPFVGYGMNLVNQRENNAFQGDQAALDRQFRQQMQSDATFQQDWLSSRNFNRNFYGQLSMMPIENAQQFSQMIAQYALQNPEVYTPETISGMTKFFNDDFRNLMSSYLSNINLGGL